MAYEDVFKSNNELIQSLGEGNAHMVWALGMYLQEPDLAALASEALTDGPNDKKIDFIYLDQGAGRIVFSQGYYSTSNKESVPSNKASDLNTAAAWLIAGNINDVPSQLREVIKNCRTALGDGDIESIELLYVHNLPESVNVTKELQTVAAYLRANLRDASSISIISRELGEKTIENLFQSQESQIEIKDELDCPAKILFTEKGPKWKASVLSVPGYWLYQLFEKHGDKLFSANYRGFLGITKRRRINTGIRLSAESKPLDFWVFNNGITLLTYGIKEMKDLTKLIGISIINGAQTTGSIGSIDITRHDLKDVRVLCRIIQCTDPDTISDIIKFNNTQNEIRTWDQYSNDPEQNRLEKEFSCLGHNYSRKRGFSPTEGQIGIEQVVQPLLAFRGRFSDANRGKNHIFERGYLYNQAFANKTARHILLVYTLARAIDERRIELKKKSSDDALIPQEEKQLALFRHLRFKYFLISVVGRVLDSILGKKVDLDTVAFLPNEANDSKNTLIDLVAYWSPVVEHVLSFLATELEPSDIGKQIAKEGALDKLAEKVAAMLYVIRGSNSIFEDFRSLVSDS